MAKHVRCCCCGNYKWMRYDIYRQNLDSYRVNSIKELNNVYLCGICSAYTRYIYDTNPLLKTKQFSELRKSIQAEVDIYIERGINDPIAYQNFLTNVKIIFDKANVTSYTFVVENDVLVGIKLEKLSIYGTAFLKLKVKKKD